jgi:phosphohistidine phosphatase
MGCITPVIFYLRYLNGMKTILLIRHAKSSWDDPAQDDFDRPLNNRGHRDAPEMATKLVIKQPLIDAFISSTAVRAFTTATYFAKAYHRTEKDIIRIPELYHASVPVFLKTIEQIDNHHSSVAIFSHNPGITAFVNELTRVRIDNMPTCGIFAITSPINHWKHFGSSEKSFLFFDHPKN